MTDALIQISWIAFFSILAQWLGWKFKTPAIVFLLIGGFIAGSAVLDVVQPEYLLGDLLQPIVSLAVGVILFEGALNLNFKQIREGRKAIHQVIYIGAPVAWVLTTLSAYYIAGLSLPVAMTIGALLIVTGPTVIMPLLKNAHLKERPASILKWEGIINDPVGAVLAILCYEFFKLSSENVELSGFFSGTILAIVMITFFGILIAYAISFLFNREIIPEYLKPAFLLSSVLIFFVICNTIEHDFGLIGVTILGVTLANMNIAAIDELKKFKETVSIMLVSGIFILLTAKIDPAILFSIDWRGFAFIACLLFFIRPLTILASSTGTNMTWKEIFLVGWIAPRGIVCAAVAGVLGPNLVALGYQDGEQLLPLAFAIVLFTVFAHGLTAKPLGKKLGLAFSGKDSLLIVGASEWAIQLAKTLKRRDVEVIIADKNWHALRDARLSDIPVYYGEMLSEETEYNLELTRYNVMLAATNNSAHNALVCNTYVHEFGRDKVYQFLPHQEGESERKKISHTMRGRTFGFADMDYWKIVADYNNGWRFRASRIGQKENYDRIVEAHKAGELKIMGHISPKGVLDLRSPRNIAHFEDFEPEDILILFEQEESDLNAAKKQLAERTAEDKANTDKDA